MSSIKLVTVQAGRDGEIVSPSLLGHVAHHVTPFVTDNTVIIVDGYQDQRVFLSPCDKYMDLLMQIDPFLPSHSDARPVLFTGDTLRCQFKTEELFNQWAEVATSVVVNVSKMITHEKVPGSWDEMIQMAKSDDFSFSVENPLSKDQIATLKEYRQVIDRQNDDRAQVIDLYRIKGKDVVVLIGPTPVLDLSLRHGWPAIVDPITSANVKNFFPIWFSVYKAVDLVG